MPTLVPPAAKAARMILEIAQIDVKPGMEAEFEAGVKKAGAIFQRAKGCKFMTLQRSHEMPQRYRLFVQSDSRKSLVWFSSVSHCTNSR